MKPPGFAKILLIAFLLALTLYVAGYGWLTYRQTRLGPWEVTFISVSNAPIIVIRQPRLGVQPVGISFAGASAASNVNVTMRFDQPRPWPFEVPFGRCVFMDTMILPGNVTLELFGHEIQLLPRVLTIDRLEHSWLSGANLVVAPSASPRGQPGGNVIPDHKTLANPP